MSEDTGSDRERLGILAWELSKALGPHMDWDDLDEVTRNVYRNLATTIAAEAKREEHDLAVRAAKSLADERIALTVAAAFETAATHAEAWLGDDDKDIGAEIRGLAVADARVALDAMLAKAREDGAREEREACAKECERNVPRAVLDRASVDPNTIVDQRSVLVCAARIRARLKG